MSKAKFNVGDKVRILDGEKINCYAGGWVSSTMSKYVGQTHTIERVDESRYDNQIGYYMKDTFYVWDERGLELVDSNWKVVIIPNGNETTATLYENNQVVKKVITKKNPSDEYSRKVACDTLVERLFGEETTKTVEPKPSYYNGEVICVNNGCIAKDLTVGKTYKFVDGMCCNNVGGQITASPVKDFTDLNSRFSIVRFIEVVK